MQVKRESDQTSTQDAFEGQSLLDVRPMVRDDLANIIRIYLESFRGMTDPQIVERWFNCVLDSYPRSRGFVIDLDGIVRGYIIWCERGGFRDRAVLELEQIAIDPAFRSRGLASQLIVKSLSYLRDSLKNEGRSLRLVVVYTSADHGASRLYEKTLNAKRECLLRNYFRGDEEVLFARFD